MSQELLERIASLERSNRRWKAWGMVAAAVLSLLLFAGVGIGVVRTLVVAAERNRARDDAEMFRARAEEAMQAEREAREMAEQQRKLAEQRKP